MVDHFQEQVIAQNKIGGQARAMVVCNGIERTIQYFHAFQDYLTENRSPYRALVAFSGDYEYNDVAVSEATLNGFPSSDIADRIQEDPYRFLICADKFQTGYDEPLLHTMYVDKKLSGVAAVQTLSRLNRTHPGKQDTFVLDFANTAEEIKAAFEPFYEESFATPTEPNVLYTMEHDLMAARVLSRVEMDAAVGALLSEDPAQQSVIYANLDPAVGRFAALDEDAAESFRKTLEHFCRAYAFVAQVMPWADADLERLFLYGRLLLLELPTGDNDPMPQLSKSVQLTHLRIAVASDEAITLAGADEPGSALPGEGKGPKAEPIMDKLSALISAMNDKYGADLGEADKVWVDQQWVVVKEDDEMREVALNNDRGQFEMVLEQKVKDLLIDRHDKNGVLFDLFFANPDFQASLVRYLAGTYDEFRQEVAT
jgi:type I restriction enzyme R subunit